VAGWLPPPDPNESLGTPDEGTSPIAAPMALFIGGKPSPEVDATAEAILEARPGALIVLVRE
jgi:hypothetical protein